MDRPRQQEPHRAGIAYFFTRFPHLTETFVQREVRAMHLIGARPALYSWHGGDAEFEGSPVFRFSKWRLLELLWRLPLESIREPAAIRRFVWRMMATRPRGWLNFWENLYGAGIGVIVAPAFRARPVAHIHAVWASLPAMAAWVVAELTHTSFSIGAHAYDLFEHGGDWLLRGKCAAARFVHTSSAAGRERLQLIGVDGSRILLVRRGLDRFPECRPLRTHRKPLRLVCVARLVEKKGLLRQLRLYQAMRDAGVDFRARIVGDGPLRRRLRGEVESLQLADCVTLVGAVPPSQVWEELRAADGLLHTGVVAASGDRDGLPNVVPEAMTAGVIVMTAPAPGVLEAIVNRETGFVCELDDSRSWIEAARLLQTDDELADRLRRQARTWVERNFDARANARLLLARMPGGAQ